MTSKYRVAYFVSHPIQYQAPMLRFIAASQEVDLTVFFLSDFSLREYRDEGFGATVQWDVPLLEGYKHIFLPALGNRQRLSPLHPLVYGIARNLKAGKFDALWLHGYAHQANLRAMLIAKRLGIKVLVRADAQLGSALRAPVTRNLKEATLRKIFACIDGFLAVGALNREYYRHYGVPECKIFSVPYAVDNAVFRLQIESAEPQVSSLRQELGISEDRPVILYASKFQARKRAGDLLEAYIRLSPDGVKEPLPYLLFVGDGEQRVELEQRANQMGWSSIHFAGFKNQTELPAYFALCDVFVLPSAKEPWGLVINEVMNAGKPIIVSDQVGAGPDLIHEGENGSIFPVGDIQTLSDRLSSLTSNREAARAMGRRSKELVDQWNFQRDLQGLVEALSFVLEDKTRRPFRSPV